MLGQPGVSSAQINSAVQFARARTGRSYDWDFSSNKKYSVSQDKEYNCSELVWKAYNYSDTENGCNYVGGRDLDSNGGNAVYPEDIYYSPLTKVDKSF